MIKEYNLFKTVKKTMRENNLVLAEKNNKILFDFSLLENMEILECDKNAIISNTQKDIVFNCDNSVFYNATFSNFEYMDGIADFINHKVYDKKGKLLYVIKQIAKIKNYHFERQSVYDNYTFTETIEKTKYNMPLNDYEI